MVFVVGHRGAMGYAPENTLASFKKAIELRVDAVELDARVCKSGELVVMHDEKVDRTTNGRGRVSEMELGELQELDAGEGERIPLLKEILDLVNRRVKVVIEIKDEGTAEMIVRVIENYVSKGWNQSDFLIHSFSLGELKRVRRTNPKIKTGVLVDSLDDLESAKKIGAFYVGLPFEFVDKKIVKKVHSFGLKIYVWAVNDSKVMERMEGFGVDGVFSNYPDRVIK